MIRLSPVLLVFMSGCAGCGSASRLEPVPPEMKIYRPAVPPLGNLHTSGNLMTVEPGAWARYRFTSDGSETVVTYGAVSKDEGSVWLEVVEEGDPKKASLRHIGFNGDVRSAKFREFPSSGPPSELAEQPITPGPDPRAASGLPTSVEKKETTLKVDSKEVKATVWRMTFRDEAVGRERQEEIAWSFAVPFLFEDSDYGGVVYRKSSAGSVTLLDWGVGYSPLIK